MCPCADWTNAEAFTIKCRLSKVIQAVHCFTTLGLQIEIPGEMVNQPVTCSMGSHLHTETLHLLRHTSLWNTAHKLRRLIQEGD